MILTLGWFLTDLSVVMCTSTEIQNVQCISDQHPMQNAFVLWYTAAATATATANVARWVIIVGKALIMLKAVYSRQDLQMADLIRGIILLECEIANVYYIHHCCILLYHSFYVLNFVVHCIGVHCFSYAFRCIESIRCHFDPTRQLTQSVQN